MVNVRMQPPEKNKLAPKITVIGVGGAGGNAVNNMISSGLEGTEFVVCNTDSQALQNCLADHKIQLGESVTGGLGAGAKPEVGRAAAEESLEEVLENLQDANMVFVTAGMGGGTGTGAAPVIARAARDQGMLTVGVVTKPFHFEGTHRMKMAEQGIEQMQEYVDTLIVIPNQNLFRIANEKTTFAEAFKMADTVLQSGVRGVTDLMVMPGLINLDFADIRSAMQEMGKAMMGTGEAEGERRAIEAAEAAISNPLLDDVTMKGARGVIINITGGYDMTLFEADEACNRIRDEIDPEANIIFGSTFDESLEGVMRVSVVATGIEAESEKQDNFSNKSSGIKVLGGQQGESLARRINEQTRAQQTHVEASQSAPRPQRAQPQTIQQSSSFPYVARASSATQQPARQSEAAPSQSAQKQGEVSQESGSGKQSVPRGQTIGGSFIPPQPLAPEQVQEVSEPSHQVQERSFHSHSAAEKTTASGEIQNAQTSQSEKEPLNGSGDLKQESSHKNLNLTGGFSPNNLKARKSGAQQENNNTHIESDNQKSAQSEGRDDDSKSSKFGSFLNRLTGGYASDKNSETSGNSHSSGNSGSNVTSPSQGKLNIDAPAAAPEHEYDDELDIPAFLRRQAN